MSDLWMNVIAWPRAPLARTLVRRVELAEVLGDLVDASGTIVHDFTRQGERISVRTCAKSMRGRGAPPEAFAGAYVEGIPMVDLGQRAIYLSSDRFAAVSVIDRAFAIPHGVPFLRGRAYRRFRPVARARAEEAWSSLLEHEGGERRLAKRIAPYCDGEGGARALEVVRAITRGFERARTLDRDLLIMGCLASEAL